MPHKTNGTSSRSTLPNASLTVLSVSPNEEDHSSLRGLLGQSRWTMLKASDLPAARAALNDYDISVIVCNTCLDSDTWVDVLNHVRAMPHPPSLIVTSRLADDRLWAEALNLGAWDVLSKPFDRSEVVRSVRYAWEHWRHQVELPARPKVLTAAS